MNEYDLNEQRDEYGNFVDRAEVTNSFLRKVFLNMIVGILITAAVPAYVFFFNQGLLYTIVPYFKIITFAELGLVFFLSLGINKMSSGTARLMFFIIMSLINFFIKAPMLYWAGTILGIVIFSALIAYDVNRIKRLAYNIAGRDREVIEKIGIIGALNLYLDFINLFLYLLRIFGKKRR